MFFSGITKTDLDAHGHHVKNIHQASVLQKKSFKTNEYELTLRNNFETMLCAVNL